MNTEHTMAHHSLITFNNVASYKTSLAFLFTAQPKTAKNSEWLVASNWPKSAIEENRGKRYTT